MCGILCGFMHKVNQQEIAKGLELLHHRGPDEKNMTIIDNVFLGHTRLSIVGIQNGTQPIFNENKTISAVVNGEFYHYQEIKKHLIQKGHTFYTLTDSEILIHLYEEYGVDCLQYLHGEFAFVLYDKNKKQWFCARDRIGIKPLQFYYKDKMFLIASEAKAIAQFHRVETGFNKEAFWFSQHLQYLPLNQTLFQNIEMIKPAHYLIIQENGFPKQFEYWSLKNIEVKKTNFQKAKEKAVELLTQSVEERIPKEVDWATHLSGGIDSSIVTAIASKNQSKMKAFTIQFTDDSFYDESDYAQETANFLKIELIKIPVSFHDLMKKFVPAIYHAEGLSINGHLGAKYILNEEIHKQGIKVVLTGEGSDEIFMGYSHLKQDYLSSHALKQMEKQYLSGVQLPDGKTLNLDVIQNYMGFVPTWIQAKASMGYKWKSLWNESFIHEQDPYQIIIEDLEGFASPLKASSASWMKYCLGGYILKVLDDAQSMAHHIEGRLPFLDTELIEYLYSLPDDIYFYKDIEKGLLRKGFKNQLPNKIIHKTKQSFMSPPMNRYLHNKDFKLMIEEYVLENKKLQNLELFDKKKMMNYFQQDNIHPNIEPIIMTLLSVGIFVKTLLGEK